MTDQSSHPFRRGVARETAALLRSLGSSAAEVASSLEAAGVKGIPKDPQRCPMATYLAAVVCSDPRVKSVSVDCRKVVIRPKSWWRMSTTVHLPEPIAEFVVAFDALCFPSLVWHPPALEAKDPVG